MYRARPGPEYHPPFRFTHGILHVFFVAPHCFLGVY